MEDFIDVKERYVWLRSLERDNMIRFLKANGYNVINERGGKGSKNYTSKNTLKIPYDLSNWKWIEIEKDGVCYLISFQPFDVDASSGNYHVLMDRLGVYTYTKYNPKEAIENMMITDIDLPMNDDKLHKLLTYL